MTALAGCADILVPAAAGIQEREPRAIQLDAPSLTIDDGSTGQLTATVLDQTGTALPTLPAGTQVSWSSAVDTIASVSPAGLVTAKFPGVTKITATVASRTGPISVGSDVTVKAVPVSLSIAAGDHQSARVATRLPDDFAVRVLDRHGLGVAGQVVAFAITAGGGTLTSASATTDSTGTASVGYTAGTTAGQAKVDVSVARLAGIVVHFSAVALPGPPAAFTKIAGDSQTAIITTTTAKKPTVRLADAYGNAVSGAAVAWSVASGGGSVPSDSGTTDSSGQASVRWTVGGQPGPQSLRASAAAGAIATLFTATAIPVPVKQVVVTPSRGTVLVHGTQAFSATTMDSVGGVLSGRTITWSSSAPTIATVDTNGLATGVAPGSATITATSEGVTVTATLDVVTPVATAVAANAGGGQTAFVGTAVATAPSVLVRDQFGNPMAGASVTFTVGGGGGSITGAAAVSDASGVASVGSWTLGAAAGVNTLTATVTGTGIAGNPVTFTATGVLVPVKQVVVSPSSGSVLVGATQAFSATTKDSAGGVLSGRTITWSSSDTTVATVDATGLATAVAPGSATITATSEGVSATATLDVVAPVATAVAANAGGGQTAFVGTTLPTAPSVLVRDQFGNPMAGASVTFAVTTGGGSITGGAAVSGASGVASVGSWVLGPAAGVNTLTATVTGTGITGNPVTFTATGVLVPVKQVVVSPTSGAVVAGTTQAFSATTKDSAGGVLSGRTITWSSSDTTVATVDHNGLATGVAPGSATITATAESVSGAGTITVTSATPVAVSIGVHSGDAQSAYVGAAVADPPAVEVLDAQNQGVVGVSVTFAVASGGGSITGAVQLTDAQGVARVGSWTLGATAGANTLTATAAVAGLAGNPVTLSATALPLATMQVDIPGPDLIGLALSNPLDITLSTPAPSGGLQLTLSSDNAGIVAPAQSTVTVPAGQTTVRATLNGLALGATTVRVSATGYAAASLAVDVTDQVVPVTPVSYEVGYYGTCAIGNGGVVTCWGQAHGATPVQEPGSGWVAFTLGAGHQCALTALGAAWCWGDNSRGQLGDDSFSNSSTPVAVAGGHTFAKIIAGDRVTCGLTTSGAVFCWGQDPFGLLGNNTPGDKSAPMEAAGQHTFRDFSSSFMTICALTTGDEPYCWGISAAGAVGDGGASLPNGVVPAPVPVLGGHHFSAISTGGGSYFTCAIEKSDGSVWCFGQNQEGELGVSQSFGGTFTPHLIPGLTLATLSTRNNAFHACGLTAAGSAVCWGLNDNGQVGDGTQTNAFGPATVVGGHTFVSIAVGTVHTCAATAGGVLYCWGSGAAIGDGIAAPHLAPTAILQGAATTLSFTTQPSAVQATQSISPAIVVVAKDAFGGTPSGGSVTLSFGRNATGTAALGGTLTQSLVNGVATFNDITVSEAGTAYSIKATSSNGLSVTSDFFDVAAPPPPPPPPVTASLDIHGTDVVGPGRTTRLDLRLGAPAPADITFTLTSDATGIVSLAAATVVVATGDSTGSVTLNGVALGSTTIRANATGVTEATIVVQVSNTIVTATPMLVGVGAAHTCTLRSGTAYCWGWNSKGQLGDGTTTNHSTPAVAASGHTFVSITAGGQFTCALESNGSAWCWGDNTFGELGNGNNTSSSTPVAVSGGHQFVRFARVNSNGAGICALTGGGEVWCWGYYQVLGTGGSSSNVPVLLPFNRTWIDVAVAGSRGACGVTSVGDVLCWSSLPQLNSFQNAPLSTAVAVGDGFTCMLDEVGKPWCLGTAFTGALGLGPGITGASFPTPVVGSEVFTALSSGLYGMCGIASGGAAYCWGIGADGEIGDGFTSNRFSPTAVSGGLSFTEIHGDGTVCGATPTGEVWCWGNNNTGQVGDGTTTNRLVPVKIF